MHKAVHESCGAAPAGWPASTRWPSAPAVHTLTVASAVPACEGPSHRCGGLGATSFDEPTNRTIAKAGTPPASAPNAIVR
jgi:hypothetical protein